MITFEEQFPSLINKHKLRLIENPGVRYRLYEEANIQEHCLDKQRLRDIINFARLTEKTGAKVSSEQTLKFLEKELGL